MIDEQRGTGRTTRDLKTALELARQGRRVLFLVRHSSFILYAASLLHSIATPERMTIRRYYYGEGSITFAHLEEQPDIYAGAVDVIVPDHDCNFTEYTHRITLSFCRALHITPHAQS